MDRITEITESVFNALIQIQRRDPASMPVPELVHQQLATYIDQCTRTGQKLGVAAQDLDEIRYALVALVDEVAVNKGGALRDFWLQHLLQLRYLNTNQAGDLFFDRLAELRRDPTRGEALRVYYLCLMFGFRGKYRVRGGEIELLDTIDAVRDELIKQKVIPSEIVLSPSGPRPYEAIADGRRNLLLIWLAAAAATTSILLYVGLWLSLQDRTARLVERLQALVGG